MINIIRINSIKYGFCELNICLKFKGKEENFIFLIREKDLFDLNIYKPKEIDIQLFNKLKYLSVTALTDYKVFEFVSKKQRSLLEVEKFLSLNGTNVYKHKEQIIAYLKKYRYLNDKEYLCQLINYYISNLYGPLKIKYKLRDKFSKDMLEEYIYQIYTFSKIRNNLLIIFNKMIKKQYISVKEFKSKFINKCSSKGFYLNDVNEFLNSLDIKIDIDLNNIYLIAQKYLNKLSQKNYSEYEKINKLKKYLLAKNISLKKIINIIDML